MGARMTSDKDIAEAVALRLRVCLELGEQDPEIHEDVQNAAADVITSALIVADMIYFVS